MASVTETGTTRTHRRHLVVASAIVAGGIALGSVAWACVPATPDIRTLVQSCTPPSGSTLACKVPIGQPAFPEATFVKGPSGSSLVAYVKGPGMQRGLAYDLLFLGKNFVDTGATCSSSSAVVISAQPGPISGLNNDISPTQGRIPAGSALGGGRICFADKTRTTSSSTPSVFKVTI